MNDRDKRIKELTEALQDECLGTTAERKAALEQLKKGDTGNTIELLDKVIEKEQCLLAENHCLKGHALYESKIPDYRQALDAYLEAEKLDPDNSKYINAVGSTYMDVAGYTEAVRYFEKALALDIKNHGEASPEVAACWNYLGMAWDSLAEYKKAIEYYEKALAIFEKTLGGQHPRTKTVRSNLASAEKKLRMVE